MKIAVRPTEPADWQGTFRDLESEVCDLERMAIISMEMAYAMINEPNVVERQGLACFATEQTLEMVKALKTKYYAAYKGDV